MEGIRISLEEQNRAFAMDNTRPAEGRLIINDDNVTVEVRNLKQTRIGYKLIFIGRKKGNSVYKFAGDIFPNKQGDAVMQIAIDPENIDGEGSELSCFYIFMIAAAGMPLQPVLKGDKVGCRKEESNGQLKAYNGYYSEYIKEKVGELIAAGNNLDDISPFDDEWLAIRWKRVNELLKLPVASAGAQTQIRKYGHFIFGTSEKHFYLAVPGRHIEEEWPDRGRSGFMMWQSIRGSGEYGYWCMVIDRKTGVITEIS